MRRFERVANRLQNDGLRQCTALVFKRNPTGLMQQLQQIALTFGGALQMAIRIEVTGCAWQHRQQRCLCPAELAGRDAKHAL